MLAGCGSGARVEPAHVELVVDGDMFRPRLELAVGSTAAVSWIDLATNRALGVGVDPTLAIAGVDRVGLAVTRSGRPAPGDVLTLNLGFDHRDDSGRVNLGPAYDHDPQPVVGLANLRVLTGMVNLCAGRTPLTGMLDVSGLPALRHVECFQAAVTGVRLAGCDSLERLCLERCRLSQLDLNPVRRSLKDLRAAVQQSPDNGLTFTTLDGPMESLYHYCVRDQAVHNTVPHRHLPVIEEYWVWNTRQVTSDAPTSPLMKSFLADKNAYDQASVDLILTSIQEHRPQGPGTVRLTGGSAAGTTAAPSATGRAAATQLRAGGWQVRTNSSWATDSSPATTR